MFKFFKTAIKYPERRHASLEDNLRTQTIQDAGPATGDSIILATWDDKFQTLPLDGLFFTALNHRACILILLSENSVSSAEVIKNVLDSGHRWQLHFSAFLRGKCPILRANLAFPDNPRDPFWLEAPLDLSDGDIQDFCSALMADETIDIIIKHQSMADGHYSLKFIARGIAAVLESEVSSVAERFKPGITRQDFNAAYDLLQQVYPSGSAGLEPAKTLSIEFVGQARNRFMQYDTSDTPEKREQHERDQAAQDEQKLQKEIEQYARRLVELPNVLDRDAGSTECNAIGAKINERWGFNGMVRVVEYVRDHYDRTKARSIERSWDGIGEWLA